MATLSCSIKWSDQKTEQLEELREDLEIILDRYNGVRFSMDIVAKNGKVLLSKTCQNDIIDIEALPIEEVIKEEVKSMSILLPSLT